MRVCVRKSAPDTCCYRTSFLYRYTNIPLRQSTHTHALHSSKLLFRHQTCSAVCTDVLQSNTRSANSSAADPNPPCLFEKPFEGALCSHGTIRARGVNNRNEMERAREKREKTTKFNSGTLKVTRGRVQVTCVCQGIGRFIKKNAGRKRIVEVVSGRRSRLAGSFDQQSGLV